MPVEFIYKLRFSETPLVVRAPGRINLLGEHTDYNMGFVLPAAIDKYVTIASGKRSDREIKLYALQYGQYDCMLDDLQPLPPCSWQNYVLGVVAALQQRGYVIGGFNAVINGDIPIGAGLSSSAAMACATAYTLNELFSLNLTPLELAQVAQTAEHDFAGVNCGIMDQFASIFGKKNRLIKLDCRSMAYEHVELFMPGYKLLLLNSNVKHNLASSAYNLRRQQCEQGVQWITENYPHVQSLRDVTMDMLKDFVLPKDKIVYKRCCYVLQENERVRYGCEDLEQRRLAAFGSKMFDTHIGLRDLYEVSCPELDFLVYSVVDNPGVLGARMMGGGFGGCTINLVSEAAIEAIVASLSYAYEKQTGLQLSAYVLEIQNGAEIVEVGEHIKQKHNII